MIRAAVAGLGWWGKHIVRRMRDSDALRVVAAIEANPALAGFADRARARASRPISLPCCATRRSTPSSCARRTRCMPSRSSPRRRPGSTSSARSRSRLTRADAERSVAACRKAGVMLGIGHERRYEPAMAEVRRLVRAGTLGTIMHAEAQFLPRQARQRPGRRLAHLAQGRSRGRHDRDGHPSHRPLRRSVRADRARSTPRRPAGSPTRTTAT